MIFEFDSLVGSFDCFLSSRIFTKKTSNKPDGVAVFWNAKKLKVNASEKVCLDLPNGDESGE